MRIIEIKAKSILVKSKLPATDYVVNPYIGCSFACGYCYASFMGRFINEPIQEWGNYVYVKTNAAELFAKEIAKFSEKKRDATILLSSVTDAWQGPEKKYQLARQILQCLNKYAYPGLVSILTKSPLILRDVDIITGLLQKEVGVTITSTDDEISRFIEAHAPRALQRLRTLKALNEANVPTYAFVGPLLPHFRYRPELLDDLFCAIRDAGTTSIFVEHLNTSPYVLGRIAPLMATADMNIRVAYESARTAEHRKAVTDLVLDLVKKYQFDLRLGRVLDHNRDKREQI